MSQISTLKNKMSLSRKLQENIRESRNLASEVISFFLDFGESSKLSPNCRKLMKVNPTYDREYYITA